MGEGKLEKPVDERGVRNLMLCSWGFTAWAMWIHLSLSSEGPRSGGSFRTRINSGWQEG